MVCEVIKERTKKTPEAYQDPLQLVSRAANKAFNLWRAYTYPFASIGKKVWLHRSCHLPRPAAKYIRIGDGVKIHRNSWINVVVVPETDEPVIIIEDGCEFGPGCTILAKNRIHIKRNTIFGASVFVTDHNHAFEDVTLPIQVQGTTPGGTVCIEEGSWVGYGAAIVCSRDDLVIGHNSIVGANALVTRSVRPRTIVSGNPARTAMHYDTSQNKWAVGATESSG